MGLLEGRSAVVTGAAQGIGLEIARTLVEEGACVVLGDRNGEGVEAVAKQLCAQKGKAIGQRCDVTSEAEVRGLIERANTEFSSLDIMVNNAGITRDATIRNMSIDDLRAVLDVHLVGAWLGTKHASMVMREQRRGSIVNISSISGKVGMIGQTNYSAAKAGLVGLTKAAAKEVAHLNVRVNAVQPGLILTAMTESLRKDIFEQKLAEIPMGRAGKPREVANVVLFLASDLSSYLTGTVLEVTGGRYM